MKTLSIIIPVHNTIKYFEQSIESVLSQTFSDFELLLVDDGSTDGCEKLADKYASKDSRVHVIHESQCGVAIARNNAIDIAEGKYLLFLDSDDYFTVSNAFELIVNEYEKSSADIVMYGYTDVEMRSGKTRNSQVGFDRASFNLPKKEFLNYIYDNGLFPTACWQMSVRKDFIASQHIRFPENIVCEDIDWGIKILYHAKKYTFVEGCLMAYRRNRTGSIMYKRGFDHLNGCMLAVKNWLDIPKEKRYLGLSNFVAHMYGYIFSYYTVIPKSQRALAEVEFKQQARILMESDKWNHHLIYHTQRLAGIYFTAWMIRIVYRIFYAPGSALGYLRKKFQ